MKNCSELATKVFVKSKKVKDSLILGFGNGLRSLVFVVRFTILVNSLIYLGLDILFNICVSLFRHSESLHRCNELGLIELFVAISVICSHPVVQLCAETLGLTNAPQGVLIGRHRGVDLIVSDEMITI